MCKRPVRNVNKEKDLRPKKRCPNGFQSRNLREDIICVCCGREFASYQSKAKYCSKECANAVHMVNRRAARGIEMTHEEALQIIKGNMAAKANPKKTKACEYCGISFAPKGKAQSYCTTSCERLHEAERISVFEKYRMRKKELRLVCPTCYLPLGQFRYKNFYYGDFCSRECCKVYITKVRRSKKSRL